MQFQHAGISYLYGRSSDSRSNNSKGQDYVAFRYDEFKILFAVCDGVGSSFCGDLAARFLGDALVEWLATLDACVDESDLAQQANVFLRELTDSGKQRVLEYAIPAGLPPLVKAALEGQRAYGSETMFVCGRLDFPDPDDLSQPGRLMLCWLGDTPVQVLDRQGRSMDIDAHWTSHERWSMNRGIRGADSVHVWIGRLTGIDRVIAYSDGLVSLADRLRDLTSTPATMQEEVERLHASPGSDDISLVEIHLRVLPSPVLLNVTEPYRVGSFELRWTAIPRADMYLVEEAENADFSRRRRAWKTRAISCCIRATPAGEYYYRVGATRGGLRSEPSNALLVHIATRNSRRIALRVAMLLVALSLAMLWARLWMGLG